MLNTLYKFKILTIDQSNKSSVIHSTLEKFGYHSFYETTLDRSYDILRQEPIDLVILNTNNSQIEAETLIKDIQNLTDCGIVFLTSEYSVDKAEQFSKYNLLAYHVKLGNLLNILKDIDLLIKKLISNSLETIMVVKPKDSTRDFITELLRLHRYKIVVVHNGASAWKKLDTIENLSLLLLDINLDDMDDSLDILIKARKKFSKNLPVISVSNIYNPISLQQNISDGLSDFIKTPIDKLEFYLKISLWIDNIKQKREIEKQNKEIENAMESFKALSNATMEALLMFEENRCVDANEEALKMFAYETKEQIIDIDLLNFVPKTVSKFDMNELLKNDTDHEFEIEMLKNDATVFPAQIKERNIFVGNNKRKVIAILDLTHIKRNENILHQQSKLAAMGEMMENIAHQWRQPLSAITISASSVLISNELDLLEDNELEEQLGAIVESAEFLSNTINDFQKFLKPDKQFLHFNLHDIIKKVLKLIDGNMKKNKINIIEDLDETVHVNSLENELIQVILNIINNAKDILVENDLPMEERIVLIKVYNDNKNENGIIEIQDSAGGIPDQIINKIFEPYFTTKHQSQGTGLGLYMSHQMITDHMKGEILVSNRSFVYENREFYGANFKVQIPIDTLQSKSSI